MTWGPQVKFLQGLKDDGEDPQALRDRPILEKHQLFYNNAFNEVSGRRHYSSAGAPLPMLVSEIKAYCELFYIDRLEERERFFKMITEMDETYCKVMSDRIKQEMEKDR